MLRTVIRALAGRSNTTPGRDTTTHPVFDTDLRRRISVLEDEVRELRHSEVTRGAEHAAMIDQLDRLYKRVSARIARSAPEAPKGPDDESPLAMRTRLRGR